MFHIVLDTSFFIANNYFVGRRTVSLSKLAKKKKIKLYITDIVYNEVLKHLIEDYDTSKSLIKKKTCAIIDLFNPDFRKEYRVKNKDDIKKLLDDWINDNSVIIIGYDKIGKDDVKSIFDNYFQGMPPFGTGDKKSEFPDAFILKMIENHFRKRDKVYIFSNDNDFKTDRDNIKVIIGRDEYAKTLDNFIKSIYGIEDQIKLTIESELRVNDYDIKQWLVNYIEKNITDQFDQYWIITDKMEVSLDKVTIHDLNLTHRIYITDLDIDEGIASIETEVTFSVDIDYEYDDDSYAIYDREDNVWYNLERETDSYSEDFAISIEMVAFFDKKENEDLSFTIENVDFPLDRIAINDQDLSVRP